MALSTWERQECVKWDTDGMAQQHLRGGGLQDLDPALAAKVYRDVNVRRPRDYWDYEAVSVSFGDQDPEFNLPINDIVQSLKRATTVREACLAKTQLYGGGNHQKVFLGEQKIELPKPYVFFLLF